MQCRWDLEDRFVVTIHLQEGKQPLQVSMDLLLPQVSSEVISLAFRFSYGQEGPGI